jgi:hypothetical protein
VDGIDYPDDEEDHPGKVAHYHCNEVDLDHLDRPDHRRPKNQNNQTNEYENNK